MDPVPHPYPHMVSLWVTFAEGIGDAALALVLWLRPALVAGAYYTAHARGWGPSPHNDPAAGGGVFMVVGDLTSLPFLAALWTRLLGEDRAA